MIIADVMALFFLVSNNFTTGTFNKDLSDFIKDHRFMSHIIAIGILYNIISKSDAEAPQIVIVIKLFAAYAVYCLMILQHPQFVLSEIAAFVVVQCLRNFVPDKNLGKYDVWASLLVAGMVVVGAWMEKVTVSHIVATLRGTRGA